MSIGSPGMLANKTVRTLVITFPEVLALYTTFNTWLHLFVLLQNSKMVPSYDCLKQLLHVLKPSLLLLHSTLNDILLLFVTRLQVCYFMDHPYSGLEWLKSSGACLFFSDALKSNCLF